jgi:hypothetical protein
VLKRILIDVVVALAVIALLSGSVVGYFWLRDAPDRAKRRKAAADLVAGLLAQKKALDTLGDVDFDTAGLTLAQLNQKLNKPTLRKSGAHDSTVVGWACADRSCAIIASFMTPFGQEIPTDSAPVVLVMMKPIVSATHTFSIDGVHLGSTAEDVDRGCKGQGYGAALAKDKITCGDGWDVRWAELDGRVSGLIFSNDQVLGKSELHEISSSKALAREVG